MSRIFINYRRQDSEGYVGRLYDHLSRHFKPEDIFMDVDNIPPGADFVQVLEDAVNQCDIFLAVIGPYWLNMADESGNRRLDEWNDFVRIEISSALKNNKYIVPVLVGSARMPAPKDLPEEINGLARRNAFEISHQRFANDVTKLAEVILNALPSRGARKPHADSEQMVAKDAALKALRMDLLNATDSPLYALRTENRFFPVVGEGNADANIVFIGQAPAKAEASHGRPFVGASGEVLDQMLNGIGLARQDIYITNLILDYAPTDPTAEQIAYYAQYVDRVLDIIQPGVIVPLGKFAMQYLLKKLDMPEKKETISKLHGQLLKAKMPYGDIHVVPLYHPAVVLYSAGQRETLRKDFEKLKLFI